MKERSFDEMIAHFNRRVAKMDIAEEYKMELLAMVIALEYKHEKTIQQWIPCNEKLPEESGEYLCTLVGVHNTGLPSECGYELPNNRGITPGWSTCEADGFKFLRDDEVLAWMSLPEPWRGEENEFI